VNILELSEKAGISVKKLRVLDKLGGLRHDDNITPLDEMRAAIKSGNRLNVGQLVHLVEHSEGLLELGRYADKARVQLAELDNPKGQGAPPEIAALTLDAFEKQPAAISALVGWLKTIIPAHPVGHSYVAARLLLGVPELSRQYDVPRLQRIMMNCREDPSFAGWWRREKQVTQNRTVYQKPAFDI
jgi:hypothetical protein